MTVGKELSDGCTKKVVLEAAKVAIGFCSESTCWFRFGVAGDKGV